MRIALTTWLSISLFMVLSAAANADIAMKIFEKDENALLIVRTADEPRGYVYYPDRKDFNEQSRAIVQELNNRVLTYVRSQKDQDVIYAQGGGPLRATKYLDHANDGHWIVVLGKQHYLSMFGQESPDWSRAIIAYSALGLGVEPATQPDKPVDTREFERNRQAFIERGEHCSPNHEAAAYQLPANASEVDALEQRAESGDAAAQFLIATLYSHGRLLEQNDAQAFEWAKKSAAQCNAFAQSLLGEMYFQGRGTERDVFAAQFLFLKSAAQGNARGALNQGLLLLKKHHRLSGWSSYAESWLGYAAEHGDGEVAQRAFAKLSELSARRAEEYRRKLQADRARQGTSRTPGATDSYDANQRFIDLSLEGLQSID